MFNNMNSGYCGYSMSNRAVEAYERGEKPLSKWKKSDIIECVNDVLNNNELINLLKKVRLEVLKSKLLKYSSWHHTSNRCNKTDFYKIDIDYVKSLKKEDIKKFIEIKTEKLELIKYKADLIYLEWSGTRKHPRATEKILKDVFILEKGCFYYAYNEKNEFIIKKKIGSNGTSIIKKE